MRFELLRIMGAGGDRRRTGSLYLAPHAAESDGRKEQGSGSCRAEGSITRLTQKSFRGGLRPGMRTGKEGRSLSETWRPMFEAG